MNTPELVPITTINPDPLNAREHPDENLEAIKASLERFQQRKPLVVWQDTVIAGNGTLAAAKELGWTELWITKVPDDWTREEASAYAIADNRTAELATWNDKLLADLLLQADQDEEGLDGLGFSNEQVAELMESLDERTFTPKDDKHEITCPECGAKFELGAK